MHEHVTCNNKNFMVSAQSKPISTHHFNIWNTHLKCMKNCENAHVMQCMSRHDHLNKTQPKNFAKISTIFKNPKNFSKTPKNFQKPKT